VYVKKAVVVCPKHRLIQGHKLFSLETNTSSSRSEATRSRSAWTGWSPTWGWPRSRQRFLPREVPLLYSGLCPQPRHSLGQGGHVEAANAALCTVKICLCVQSESAKPLRWNIVSLIQKAELFFCLYTFIFESVKPKVGILLIVNPLSSLLPCPSVPPTYFYPCQLLHWFKFLHIFSFPYKSFNHGIQPSRDAEGQTDPAEWAEGNWQGADEEAAPEIAVKGDKQHEDAKRLRQFTNCVMETGNLAMPLPIVPTSADYIELEGEFQNSHQHRLRFGKHSLVSVKAVSCFSSSQELSGISVSRIASKPPCKHRYS
jgi:hypothetical protein